MSDHLLPHPAPSRATTHASLEGLAKRALNLSAIIARHLEISLNELINRQNLWVY